MNYKRKYDTAYKRNNCGGSNEYYHAGRNGKRGYYYNKEWKGEGGCSGDGMVSKNAKFYKEDKGFYYNNSSNSGSGGNYYYNRDKSYNRRYSRSRSRSRSKSRSRSVSKERSVSDSKSHQDNYYYYYGNNSKHTFKSYTHGGSSNNNEYSNLSNYKSLNDSNKTKERNKYSNNNNNDYKQTKRNNSYYYHSNNNTNNTNYQSNNNTNDKQRDNEYYHTKHKNRTYSYNNSNNNTSQSTKKEIPRNISNTKLEIAQEKEKEPSNTLLITNLNPSIHQELLQDIFREKCLDFKTSMPEDIRIIEDLKIAYIIFPSISICMTVYESLQGKIFINGTLYPLSYTPNLQQNTNKESITYVTHLTDSNLFTTSMETIVHEDWFCEYVT
jgi:hypothetical protein